MRVMLPLWKIRREIKRLQQQLRGLVDWVIDPVKQRKLDSLVAVGLPRVDGLLCVSNKIAVLLVYQPSGISVSTIATCSWLAEQGYAPFVVSNAPISSNDKERLSKVIWRAVERPNFGYDFGGYRDGLICLKQWAIIADELLVLNDSVWLPTLPQTDILDRLSNHPSDVAGTILRRRGHVQFLESYLYRFNRNALTHPSFSEFWEQLRLTSNKYYVIRRGERGFSEAMHDAGLTVAGIYESSEFLNKIREQGNTFLKLTLKYAAYIDAHLEAERDHLLQTSGTDWRVQVLSHIERTLYKRLSYSSFPYAMVKLTGYPLLKKSKEPVSSAWRREYLAAVEAGCLPQPSEEILAEIRSRDYQK